MIIKYKKLFAKEDKKTSSVRRVAMWSGYRNV